MIGASLRSPLHSNQTSLARATSLSHVLNQEVSVENLLPVLPLPPLRGDEQGASRGGILLLEADPRARVLVRVKVVLEVVLLPGQDLAVKGLDLD